MQFQAGSDVKGFQFKRWPYERDMDVVPASEEPCSKVSQTHRCAGSVA
jgi:hypothetical protein